jgi:hypothetical protein
LKPRPFKTGAESSFPRRLLLFGCGVVVVADDAGNFPCTVFVLLFSLSFLFVRGTRMGTMAEDGMFRGSAAQFIACQVSDIWVEGQFDKPSTTKDTKVHEGKSTEQSVRVICG